MEKPLERMATLMALLTRYSHRYGPNASNRMLGWIDEYNNLRYQNPEAWKAHCVRFNSDPDHNAYDCLA